jgi:uncharacterized protein YdeI (YjbR/CyaY-like superfamily)
MKKIHSTFSAKESEDRQRRIEKYPRNTHKRHGQERQNFVNVRRIQVAMLSMELGRAFGA